MIYATIQVKSLYRRKDFELRNV